MKYFVIIVALFLFACEAKSNNAQVNDTSSKEDAFTEQPVAAAGSEANDGEGDYREPEELYEEGEVADESEEESIDNEEAAPTEEEGMDSDEEEEVEEEDEPSADEE